MAQPERDGGPVDAPAGVLLLAWAVIALGVADRDGRYSAVALTCVLVGVGLIATVLLAPGTLRVVTPRRGLAAAAAVVVVGGLVWAPAFYARGRWLLVSHAASRAAAVAAGLAVLALLSWKRRRAAALVAAGLGLLAGGAMVLAAPRPLIDVWFLLQGSTEGLAHGADLYRQSWPGSPGLTDVYPYLPWTSVLLTPARLLAGDVRWGLLVALGLAVLAVRRLGGPRVPWLVALLPLLLPKEPYAVQQGWTEPLLVALLAGAVLAVARDRRGLAVVALAVALASKQHVALLLPLVVAWLGWRRAAAVVGGAVLLVAPWLVAGPRDLLHDVVTANLALPVRADGLDLPALLVRHGVVVGFTLPVLCYLAALALALRRVQRTPAWFAGSAALVLAAFEVADKQTYFNHWTLPLGLVAAAAALSWPGLLPTVGDEPRSALALAEPDRLASRATATPAA